MSEPMGVPLSSVPPEFSRYARQVALPVIGVEGQRRLAAARVVVVGIGALGSASASLLVRAGVGFVRLVDRDVIELDNLQRQTLFDEQDVEAGLPKAIAAARKLAAANGAVKVEPLVADIGPRNVERLVSDCDLLVDGSDNFELRLLVNDAALRLRVPWIYGAAIGSRGCTFTILPGEGPCFRCLLPTLPAPGSVPTCETAGVLGSAPAAVAAFQAAEATKLLAGRRSDLVREVRYLDLWDGTLECVSVQKSPDCPACSQGRYEYLDGTRGASGTKMCGRTAIQVDPGPVPPVDFVGLASRLASAGSVRFNEHLLRFQTVSLEISLFPDGRAIIKGAQDEPSARATYARYIGS